MFNLVFILKESVNHSVNPISRWNTNSSIVTLHLWDHRMDYLCYRNTKYRCVSKDTSDTSESLSTCIEF